MAVLQVFVGVLLVGVALWDIFLTMVLPRTFASRARVSRYFYRATWPVMARLGARVSSPRNRDSVLALYGPLSLLALIACWATVLIFGFAFLHAAADMLSGDGRSFFRDLYLSGTTFFTLGLGDEIPHHALDRVLTVIEAGTGFGVLAIVIGYLPVLYQAFARRELEIVVLASRAGYPCTATGLLTRIGRTPSEARMMTALEGYERWCAEIMENHSSYPMLAFYRSQHERQSWLASLTMLLDACALLQIGFENHPEWKAAVEDQAELTFAMGCRALVKLTSLFDVTPDEQHLDRLPPMRLRRLRMELAEANLDLCSDEAAETRLAELRRLYEPSAFALADRLLLDLPPFVVRPDAFEPTTPEAAVKEAEELRL